MRTNRICHDGRRSSCACSTRAGGGYDQGLWIARDSLGEGFRIIAPSRFGYLRTPLPQDASPAAQADAYACLLDALNISKVAVMGISAGASSSMQFALRYPERTSSLVLIVLELMPPKILSKAQAGAFAIHTQYDVQIGFSTMDCNESIPIECALSHRHASSNPGQAHGRTKG